MVNVKTVHVTILAAAPIAELAPLEIIVIHKVFHVQRKRFLVFPEILDNSFISIRRMLELVRTIVTDQIIHSELRFEYPSSFSA